MLTSSVDDQLHPAWYSTAWLVLLSSLASEFIRQSAFSFAPWLWQICLSVISKSSATKQQATTTTTTTTTTISSTTTTTSTTTTF